MSKRRNVLVSFLCIIMCALSVFSLRVYMAAKNIPREFYITKGHRQTLIENVPVSLTTTPNNINFRINKKNSTIYINPKCEGNYTGKLKLFGFLPFKQVIFKVMPEIKVIPGGNVIGIKLHNKGVMIIDTCKVRCIDKKDINLAEKYNIRIGDIITRVNNEQVGDTGELLNIISRSKGKNLRMEINREGKIIERNIRPLLDRNSKSYKIGVWVRDQTAGIGTMTFYEPKTNSYAALGHPIMDADTGLKYGVSKGSILKAEILSVKKGVDGEPGELEGVFVDEKNPIGNITDNNQCGIYGKIEKKAIKNEYANRALPVAYSSEVKEGKASILCTLASNKVEKYDIQILRINRDFDDTTKNMIIEITDPRLLQQAGGIVQGMSGSPIIQNDKLVGAVTHVFVNSSKKGFAIFSELMVDKLKNVSSGEAMDNEGVKIAI